MKLICDYWNGGKWQWRYLELRPGYPVGRWFDFGPPHDTHQQANDWIGVRK